MIAGVQISQGIFANNILTALKPSLEHDRKHVLQLFRLYDDQALHLLSRLLSNAKAMVANFVSFPVGNMYRISLKNICELDPPWLPR